MGKLSLYCNTVCAMKPSQVYYRLRKMAGMKSSLGCAARNYAYGDSVFALAAAEDMDFDSTFLKRFPTDELLKDHVTFLYEGEDIDWNGSWNYPDRTPLWNFNLHYFEYLLPLTAAYKSSGDMAYLNKIKECIRGWIHANPCTKGGNAWSAYTISLRLTNWLAVYSWMHGIISQDRAFEREFLLSAHEQFVYLLQHLEKDLLGNHYFEDLKTAVLCALFFEDEAVLQKSLKLLLAQCREQILPDGMHFELSPMYHKIILEDMIRVAAALRGAGKANAELEAYLQPMVDAAYSMENGLERLPLFNDCGSNVSKSLTALCAAAEHLFGIRPEKKMQLPDAGYYIFEQGDLRLIVDAGKPGPEYLPGHAHCDCMSFELFKAEKPVLINCGTYAYQCKERLWFKSTEAHNTVMADGVEQSHCWGTFRMAERSTVKILNLTDCSIKMEMTDQKGNKIQRTVTLVENCLRIQDSCTGKKLKAFLHSQENLQLYTENEVSTEEQIYAPEFGKWGPVICCKIESEDSLTYSIAF